MADPFAEVAARLDVRTVPFTDRGSRIMVFRRGDGLAVRLAERNPRLDPAQGNYRVRQPLVWGLQVTDGEGRPLPVALRAEPHRLRLDTPIGPADLVFQTPELLCLLLPPGRLGVRFTVGADRGAADRRGGTLRGARNVAYTTNARILDNALERDGPAWTARLLLDSRPGDALTLNLTPRLGFDRRLHPDRALAAAEQRWRQWFAAAPAVEDAWAGAYAYAWWVMGAGLITSRFHFTREAMLPSKVHYVGVWQWDAYFHALAYRHLDAQLAQDQCRIVFDHQRDDGLLPDAVYDEGVVTALDEPLSGTVTKPPLAAWAVWKVFEATGDRDFLEETYEALVRWNEWWTGGRDGLCAYTHPYASGLDDSPLWDAGMPVESPDLNSYLVMHMDALARIADAIGLADDAAAWRARADRHLEQLIERAYDREAGLFWPYRIAEGRRERVAVLTPFSLAPLWTGRLPREIADRLCAHLADPQEFWTAYPVPTVARSEPGYAPAQMWRGPTWANINYLFVEGLRAAGRGELASALCDRTLGMIARLPDVAEYYHPETGAAPPSAAPMQGWTAAVFIDLAVQRARGLV